MMSEPKAKMPNVIEPPTSLTDVLGQSEQVQELVKESAEELLSVNTALRQGLDSAERPTAVVVAEALCKNESVERKVDDASAKLGVVNKALAGEVRDRVRLDHHIAAVTEQQQVARHASLHDDLTGLPNRALFRDRLKQGIAQAKRYHRTLAVMFLDLDQFKEINDLNGHDVGDRVLATVALRLKESIRSDDTVSRFGGDEFVFLLMEVADANAVAIVAEKIIMAIKEPMNVMARDCNIAMSLKASMGISIFPKDGNTVDALVSSADKAMYQAKRTKSGFSFS